MRMGTGPSPQPLPSRRSPGSSSPRRRPAANDTSEFSSDVAVQGQINLVLTASATPNPVLAGGI